MNLKYSFEKYVYPARWMSYWHQIREILVLAPHTVLEIGVGDGTVFNYLKAQGIDIVSLDNEDALKPDIIADVLKMPFEENSFDAVLCAEVLEHLPFKEFERALTELKRVAKKYVVLSLPHFGPAIKFSLKTPLMKEKRLSFKIPFPINHKFNGEHHWEIGKRGYPITKIRNIIKKHFKIKKDFVPFENQYHHFFVLEK